MFSKTTIITYTYTHTFIYIRYEDEVVVLESLTKDLISLDFVHKAVEQTRERDNNV